MYSFYDFKERKSENKEQIDRFNTYAKEVKRFLAKLEEIDKRIENAVSVKPVDDEKEKS